MRGGYVVERVQLFQLVEAGHQMRDSHSQRHTDLQWGVCVFVCDIKRTQHALLLQCEVCRMYFVLRKLLHIIHMYMYICSFLHTCPQRKVVNEIWVLRVKRTNSVPQ